MPVHSYPKVRQPVQILRALGNERRFVTTEVLEDKRMTCGELAHYHGIAMPSMSRHLHILLKTDVISSIREAGNVYFFLAPDFLPQWHAIKKALGKRKRK